MPTPRSSSLRSHGDSPSAAEPLAGPLEMNFVVGFAPYRGLCLPFRSVLGPPRGLTFLPLSSSCRPRSHGIGFWSFWSAGGLRLWLRVDSASGRRVAPPACRWVTPPYIIWAEGQLLFWTPALAGRAAREQVLFVIKFSHPEAPQEHARAVLCFAALALDCCLRPSEAPRRVFRAGGRCG